jgi:hypothetical protein
VGVGINGGGVHRYSGGAASSLGSVIAHIALSGLTAAAYSTHT